MVYFPCRWRFRPGLTQEPPVTKIETLIARVQIVDAADVEIAFCRGQQARAHNRPKTGILVPKLEPAQLAAWAKGWDAADAKLQG